MNTINDRINSLISDISGGNKRAFAIKMGISPSVIENIVGSRKSKPSFDILETLARSVENINTEWLITGTGNMYLNQDKTKSEIIPSPISFTESMFFDLLREKDLKIEDLNRMIGRLEAEIEILKK